MKSALGLPPRPVQLLAWMCVGMYATWWYYDSYLLQSWSPPGVADMRFYSALIAGAVLGALLHLGSLCVIWIFAEAKHHVD